MKFKGKSNIIKEVQGKLGLKADGIDGPATWKMIWENLVHDDKGEPEKPEPPTQELKDDYPEVYKASPNQSGPIKPKYVILHHSSGSHDGTRSWILNAASSWKGVSGLNGHSVGISFYGDTNKRTPSAVEIDSAAKKCKYLMDKFDLGIDNILTHEMIAPNRKNDTSNETYQMVINRIKEL
jgi:hypothetical protein